MIAFTIKSTVQLEVVPDSGARLHKSKLEDYLSDFGRKVQDPEVSLSDTDLVREQASPRENIHAADWGRPTL